MIRLWNKIWFNPPSSQSQRSFYYRSSVNHQLMRLWHLWQIQLMCLNIMEVVMEVQLRSRLNPGLFEPRARGSFSSWSGSLQIKPSDRELQTDRRHVQKLSVVSGWDEDEDEAAVAQSDGSVQKMRELTGLWSRAVSWLLRLTDINPGGFSGCVTQ